MKFSNQFQMGRALNFILIVAGVTLGAASVLKFATLTNVPYKIDPALLFFTAFEAQTLVCLLEMAVAFVLLSSQFSLFQKYIALGSLTTLFCVYRYASLPLTYCGCLGNFESEWFKTVSPIASTVLLGFYVTVSVLMGIAVTYSSVSDNTEKMA
jgi:hypothetical protein